MGSRQGRSFSRGHDLYLIGAGGHGKVVADIAARMGKYRVRGFWDESSAKVGQRLGGIPVLGPPRSLAKYLGRRGARAVVAIGSNRLRALNAARLSRQGFMFATLVHPRAIVAPDVFLGEGSVVMAGAVINSGTRVGRNVIVNTGATVDHDCVLEDNVHISPGAHLAGGVHVGLEAHVGIGSVAIQNIRIGARSVVGAGAVVIRDVSRDIVVVGNPARPLEPMNRKKTMQRAVYEAE